MKLADLPDLECACAGVRRVSRLVTQLYAQEIGTVVEPSQFALLAALHRMPGSSQAPLGVAMGLDKTTLSRNLRLMRENGWIVPVKAHGADHDRRERGYRLTPKGQQMLSDAKPAWKRAQSRLRAAMSDVDWENMHRTFGLVARAAVEAASQEQETDS